MQVETKNIERLPNHTYYHESTGIVNSVTTIIKKGRTFNGNKEAMQNGTYMHQALEVFFKGNPEVFKNVFNGLSEELQHKVRSITGFIKQEKLTPTNSELTFITTDDKAKFGGTIDLLCKDLAIDFKSGNILKDKSINKDYLEQISTYAKCSNKKEALLLYFENDVLKNFSLNESDIEQNYNNFKSKALVFTNELTDFNRDMLAEFQEYASLNNEIEKLELKTEELKARIEHKIKENKLTKYSIDNYSIYQVQGKTTKTLKKDIKEKLLAEHEDYFTVQTGNPYFTIRELKNDKKNRLL